jgi:hypothetical protein
MRILVGFLFASVYSFSQAITPFTLTDVSQRFDATGKLVSVSRFLFAANRNGSIVAVDLDPSAGRTRQIIDVSTHRIIFIDPNSRSASEVPYYWPRIGSSNACEERFHSIRGAVVSVDRSAGSIFGVSVQRVLGGRGNCQRRWDRRRAEARLARC